MSTICGLYTKSGRIEQNETIAMMDELNRKRFDTAKVWQSETAFLGSHLSFAVPESLNEILPFHDEVSSLVITADAIIDNRSELFKLLDITERPAGISDSYLILAAFKKWGIDCPNKLIGDFAFAIWNEKKQELFCACDHVGKRVLYYYDSAELFAFSTLINPLFQIQSIKKELNEVYVADFLGIPSITPELNHEITIYKNIFKIPPATSMLITTSGIKTWQYWEAKKGQPIVFKTDNEYESAFLEVFSEAVKCRMRSTNNIGIMLSGGLDSGAVASIAAHELKGTDKLLYGFTQVPMQGFQNFFSKNALVNERALVEELCRLHKNIRPAFIASEGKSPLTEIDFLTSIIEQPYKNFLNSHWINEILNEAQKTDVGVLLDGQSGNMTVSFGDFNTYITDLINQRKFITCFREIRAYSKLKNIKFTRSLRNCAYRALPLCVKKVLHKFKGGENYFELFSPINPDFYKKMGVKAKIKDPDILDNKNSYNERLKILNSVVFSYIGAFETKLAVEFGIVKRDPTRDKRVIEFCLNIPGNQWVRDGKERRLIRLAMKGLMPDKIRLNTSIGKQAADWLQRIAPEWEKFWNEMSTIGDFELERRYLDIPKIKLKLAQNKKIDVKNHTNAAIWLLIRALIFSRFLRKNFAEKKEH